MVYVLLVTDRAGSFPLLLKRPPPRLLNGGQIVVSTLATFADRAEAEAFLEQLRGVEMPKRERTSAEREALERHGLCPSGTPTGKGLGTNYVVVLGFDSTGVRPLILRDDASVLGTEDVRCRFVAQTDDPEQAMRVVELLQRTIRGGELRR